MGKCWLKTSQSVDFPVATGFVLLRSGACVTILACATGVLSCAADFTRTRSRVRLNLFEVILLMNLMSLSVSMRCFRLPVVLLVCTVLTGCLNPVSRQALRGEHQDLVRESGSGSYADLSPMDHYTVCKALLSVQRYSELDRCMPSLWARAEQEKFVEGIVVHSPESVKLMLSVLEAKKFLDLGAVEQATEYANRSLAIAESRPVLQMNGILAAYTTIATFGLNNPNSEGSYFRKGEELLILEPWGLMAVTAELRGDGESGEQFRELMRQRYAAADKSEIENLYELPTLRYWLARSYYVAGDFDAAYDILTRDDRGAGKKAGDAVMGAILQIYRPLLDPVALTMSGTTLHNMTFTTELPVRVMVARSAWKSGRVEIARRDYDQLLGNPRIANFAAVHFRLLHERALIAEHEGDGAGAESYLRRAIELLESQRANLEQESYRLGFVGDKVDVYADMIRLLIGQQRFAEAFEFVERSKARALVDMLASRTGFSSNTTAASRVNELLRQLEELERQSLEQGVAGEPDGAARRGGKRQTLQQALAAEAPELASLVTVGDINVDDIRSRLQPGETLLEYYGHGGDLYAFIVTAGRIDAVRLNGEGLADAVTRLRRSVQSVRSNGYQRRTQRMYDRLVRPLEGRLQGTSLTIVAHGSLHYLPFAALHDGSGFLVDRYEIRLLPSASILQFLDKGSEATQDLLALGNPDLGNPEMDLPGAQQETRVIDRGWQNSRVLLRELASEANFKTYAPGFRYLHLASHGEFNAEVPLQSRLLLAPGGGEDGSLTVDELYNLRLNADMVTLSACETGLGDIQSGDDVIGLTRGFLYAGSRSIVASLWPVSDEATAYLMMRFYEELKTQPKAIALRKAQVATKARFRHPAYWSAFNLTGSG